MFKDYYSILGINSNSSSEDIKKAFRRQAIRWHPDKNIGANTIGKMQDINEAYLILKDEEAKNKYDDEFNSFTKNTTYSRYNKETVSTNSYSYPDYVFFDPDLERWMKNAALQSIQLAKETIKEFAEVTGKGIFEGVTSAIGYSVLVGIIFIIIGLLGRACK